ncbi:hypothetical protein ACFV5G_07705 [Streptomyces sp. NPDC059766]|uniref:hypothetical protein n=1 Tax=Streptomyces sp. NPDC059766 TaxID=3346940 RepID=UPI003660562D
MSVRQYDMDASPTFVLDLVGAVLDEFVDLSIAVATPGYVAFQVCVLQHVPGIGSIYGETAIGQLTYSGEDIKQVGIGRLHGARNSFGP